MFRCKSSLVGPLPSSSLRGASRSLAVPLLTSLALVLATTACEGWTWLERGKERPLDESPLTLKVLGTRACEGPRPSGDAPPRRLLGVEIELTSWHPHNVPVNFFYATLDDGAGSTYRALPSGCEPVLGGAPLAEGQSARGFLTFPTAPLERDSRRDYRLRYDPRLTGAPNGVKTSVELSLGPVE